MVSKEIFFFDFTRQINFYILDLDHCENYKARNYEYSTYYNLHTIIDNNSEDYLVDLKLYVLANKEIYILLSPTSNISNNTVYYEFGMNK